MKTYEKRTIPERQVDEVVGCKCDLCGREGKSGWRGDSFDVADTVVTVEVRMKEGVSFPEGGSGTEFDIDICPDCFRGKLVPWLRSQGATIKETGWDW